MDPIRTMDTNREFGGPEGSGILPLPANVNNEGTVRVSSVWELTDEDRDKIAQGAHIELDVVTYPPPPVDLRVRAPDGMEWSETLLMYRRAEDDPGEPVA